MNVYVLTRNKYFSKKLEKSEVRSTLSSFYSPQKLHSALEEHSGPFSVLIDEGFGIDSVLPIYLKYNGKKNFGRLFVVSSTDLPNGVITNDNLCMVSQEMLDECLDKYLSAGSETVGEKDADYICGSSELIQNLRDEIEKVGKEDCNVIVYGESGSGKELVARQIARYRPGNAVFVNCALISSSLADSFLFGHRKGAFSGADEDKIGLVEEADGSTLILDEFEELSDSTQAKLLRFAESREFRRLGENKIRFSNCRIVAVTNRTIADLVQHNQLRLDLYMRLGQAIITTPSLHENTEDIEELVRFYERKKGYEDQIQDIESLKAYSWPGNVRELFSAVDRIHRNGLEQNKLTKKDICPVENIFIRKEC